MNNNDLVAKLWKLCDNLRDGGVSYQNYVNELASLLFLKMCKETGQEAEYLPEGYRWDDLKSRIGQEQLQFYRKMLVHLGEDNKKLGQVLYALAHSSLKPEFSIEYTVADVEKCKNELLHKAIEDSVQKAQVLTTAANVKLGEIQAIDYSWGEIDFVTKPMNEMRLMECTECEMSAPATYDIDIEADDIDVTDTVTVVWEIA